MRIQVLPKCTTVHIILSAHVTFTVEPPNNGHSGTSVLSFVQWLSLHQRYSRNVWTIIGRARTVCPL